ncbi:uncharacterized protein LOC100373613 [Saccoglossus kowalevskii]|uniref:Leucine-rich repeat protein SHOC-2-like n=1 Tax=Saccoglossus kowalevskii TaxID=10224 RepID=A0ABM0GM64_SACKO|nr:PREDICTED: leucine-rich repeat protein SHOC-2-like [Saccoglossus kowalevskii]
MALEHESCDKRDYLIHAKLKEARTSHCLSFNNTKLNRIPKEVFTKLTSLRHLYLSGCNLQGVVPIEFMELPLLESLDLSVNGFDELPADVCRKLTRLEMLDISSNKLVVLPTTISCMKNLRELNLSENRLVDLPDQLGNLPHLQVLDLSSNLLREIPPGVLTGSMGETLTQFSVRNNLLTKFSDEIGALKYLEELDLRDNNFINMPRAVRTLINLKAFYYAGNRWRRCHRPYRQGVPDNGVASYGAGALDRLFTFVHPRY